MSDFSEYLKPGKRGYLIGIGGVSMSPLAEVLQGAQLRITGSDMSDSAKVEQLRKLAIAARFHDRLMVLHRYVKRRRGLARKTDQTVAVRTVVRDLKFHNGVVVADDLVDVLPDMAVLVVQDPDAVGFRVRQIVLRQRQLAERAQHARRCDAAQLALRDVHAAGQVGVVLRHGDEIALVHVLRARDDLLGLASRAGLQWHLGRPCPHDQFAPDRSGDPGDALPGRAGAG